MAWKKDGEALALVDGNPVWIDDTGTERPVDYVKLSKNLSDVTRESVERKEKLRAYEARYAALKDVENVEEWVSESNKARDFMANASNDKKNLEEQIAARIDAATKPLNEKLAQAVRNAEDLSKTLLVEKIGNAFARSEYVKKNLVDPALAADLFAGKFYLKDGQLVGRDDAGRDLYGAEGKLATFDESIVHFVNASPYKNVLLKGAYATGAGSNPSTSGGNGVGGKNPFKGDSWNVTEQNRLFKENPEQAKAFMKEAGLSLGI